MSQPSPLSDDLFAFLEDLDRNNNRDWFQANKSRFEREVRDPAVQLIAQLEAPLRRSAPMLRVLARRSGGSLMRIYRDTRFSKDKTPYKTNVAISLRHQADENIHGPGIYIHLAADECFVGAGCWRPQRDVLAAIRRAIDIDPPAWHRARDQKKFRALYQLHGESLKTAPRDYRRCHPEIEDLRRLDYMALAEISHSELTSPGAAQRIVELIRAARPLMQFLCNAIDVPY